MIDHVEVLRHMKETIKAIMPSEVEALDAAIAAMAAPQPPSGGDGLGEGGRYWRERAEFWRAQAVALGWREKRDAENGEAAPPSAPVGVEAEALLDALEEAAEYEHGRGLIWQGYGGNRDEKLAVIRAALAQQPAAEAEAEAERKFFAQDFYEEAREGKVAWPDQQPAAVDEVLAEEANERAAIAAYEKHMGVSADDPAYGPDLAQWMAGWNAALAAQPGGSDNG